MLWRTHQEGTEPKYYTPTLTTHIYIYSYIHIVFIQECIPVGHSFPTAPGRSVRTAECCPGSMEPLRCAGPVVHICLLPPYNTIIIISSMISYHSPVRKVLSIAGSGTAPQNGFGRSSLSITMTYPPSLTKYPLQSLRSPCEDIV
jgi:hypothetical protein